MTQAICDKCSEGFGRHYEFCIVCHEKCSTKEYKNNKAICYGCNGASDLWKVLDLSGRTPGLNYSIIIKEPYGPHALVCRDMDQNITISPNTSSGIGVLLDYAYELNSQQHGQTSTVTQEERDEIKQLAEEEYDKLGLLKRFKLWVAEAWQKLERYL